MINRAHRAIQLVVLTVKTVKAVVFPQPDRPFWSWTQLDVQESTPVNEAVNDAKEHRRQYRDVPVSQTTVNS